jgi:hypothetical protein
MPVLDYYHLCEEVVNRDDGNMNIIGLFEYFAGGDLSILKQMDIILFWSCIPGEHFRVRIEMRSGITGKIETFTNTITVSVDSGSLTHLHSGQSTTFRLHNINIDSPGTYYINVLVDETVIRSIPLAIIQATG